MSAIAGAVGLDGRAFGALELSPVLAALAPLGPDGNGLWSAAVGPMDVALGVVRRRRVAEDDADGQPVTTAGGRVVVVADVVLDNRPQLCAELGVADRPTLADGAVVAEAYLRWGDRFPEHLVGEFAVALADTRRPGVLLARDHLGVRPLHLHRGRDWIGFASTALAVSAFPGVGLNADVDRARDFLALVPTSTRSWVAGVRPVSPATTVWITPTGLRERRYWSLTDTSPDHRSFEEHAEALWDALDTAVACRLRRGLRVGVQLSGGLASSSLAAAAAERAHPDVLHTYTVVPPEGWAGPAAVGCESDERPGVAALGERHGNLVPTVLDACGVGVLDGYDEQFAAGATPTGDVAEDLWVRVAQRAAAADGVSLLLDGGLGGDAFAGDEPWWLLDLLRAGRPVSLVLEARAWAQAHDEAWWPVLQGSLVQPLIPTALQRWRRVQRGQRAPLVEWLAATALRPDQYRRVDPADVPLPPATLADARRAGPRTWRANPAAHAESRAVAAAQHGLRLSDPLGDVRLLETAARQPRELRRRAGWDRAVARRAAAGHLPDTIRLRRTRAARLLDWLDRFADDRAALRAEVAEAHAHELSRQLIDTERLQADLDRWPSPEATAEPAVVREYRGALGRALVVSRYLRWLDERRQTEPAPARWRTWRPPTGATTGMTPGPLPS